MNKIKLLDKEFQLYIPYEKIKAVTQQVAQNLTSDLR